jgi:hypothetical protein
MHNAGAGSRSTRILRVVHGGDARATALAKFFSQDRDGVFIGFSGMNHDGQIQFARDRELATEDITLHIAW